MGPQLRNSVYRYCLTSVMCVTFYAISLATVALVYVTHALTAFITEGD